MHFCSESYNHCFVTLLYFINFILFLVVGSNILHRDFLGVEGKEWIYSEFSLLGHQNREFLVAKWEFLSKKRV